MGSLFHPQDGTDEGTLSEIRRLYVQDGKVISNAASSIPGVTGNAITDTFCDAQQLGRSFVLSRLSKSTSLFDVGFWFLSCF